LIAYLFEKLRFLPVVFIYLSIPLNSLIANEERDPLAIYMQVMSCYKDVKYCNEVLFKINDYQKNAAKNKKFSCQTRLLGLEANLIMAKNSNFKRSEAKNILGDIKKYC
tara:strand:+ start:157 stop:483 length:327 start_codon:yes stop_codon:yes gene_type:complete